MNTIYKYPFVIDDLFTLELPLGHQVLSFQYQGSIPCLWIMVNPENKKQIVRFRVIGTGHSIKDAHRLEFIASMQDAPFVWHIFKEVN
jgi:hypothetical protein